MGLNRAKWENGTRPVVLALLLVMFVLGTSSVALGAFVSSNSKVLGVGRIQSVAPDSPADIQTKLVIDSSEEAQAVELITTPIEREVVVPEPDPAIPIAISTSGDQSSSASGGWSTGMASAYSLGDFGVDSYTANGSILTDSSMGVAVPAEWAYLLGSTVEIAYGDVVVTAVVNDTGGFLRYGRALDLQPGVWKAFGFSSVYDWGVRSVSWRIVG